MHCRGSSYQLFELVVTLALESPQRVARLAELFRNKISENMQLDKHGQYRQAFYNAVDEKAEKVSAHLNAGR